MRLTGIRRPFSVTAAVVLFSGINVLSGGANAYAGPFEVQSLDGSGNNLAHPNWGKAGNAYPRVAAADYADGLSQMVNGPNARYVSNRVFNDLSIDKGELLAPNIFSETQISQWGWVWAQFLDHNIDLALGGESFQPQGEKADIALDPNDPLDIFHTPADIPFTRSYPVPGTGVTNPRESANTVSSYIDAYSVYGTSDRLDWMREGTQGGDPATRSPLMMLPGGYLPTRDARGDASSAPVMELGSGLVSSPGSAIVTGDVRGNENIQLTALQTLFVREHNRIVGLLPKGMSDSEKFNIARRTVIAEIQYITYHEFLPAVGVKVPDYRGYDPRIDTDVSTEFATVGFRTHSTVNGDVTVSTEASRYTQAQLDQFQKEGLQPTLSADGKTVGLTVVLPQELFDPSLVKDIGLGPLLQGIGFKANYKNDEIISGLLRSVPCADPPTCVSDLGAVDLQRGRDHGIPSYNALRRAYGLPPVTSFTQITGESSDSFPSDPRLPPGKEIDSPASLTFTHLYNLFGDDLPLRSDAALHTPVQSVRLTPLAARLKAIYGSVDKVDAYVGMVSEKHLAGSDFGPLQQAIWAREFRRLRDGDRFFYGNQIPALALIKARYGIDFRRNLGDLIAANTDIPRSQLPPTVFFVHGDVPPGRCQVSYKVDSQSGSGSGDFTAHATVTNTGDKALNNWTLRFRYLSGQVVGQVDNGVAAQNGVDVPITNTAANARLYPGQSVTVGIKGTWKDANPDPDAFSFNTTACQIR